MKSYISSSLRIFINGCDRANGLTAIYKYLITAAPKAMDADDLLRSSVVLCVSAFDLFIHDLYRTEILHRFISKKSCPKIKIPFNAAFLTGIEQITAIDDQIRLENSYKSFVAPEKLGDCIRYFIDNPWDKISVILGTPSKTCRGQLKSIVDLRNRIAHEGDVNPNLGGVDLWPIYVEDVEASVTYLRKLGIAIAQIIDAS